MAKKIVFKIINFYQNFVSPLFGNHCRFYPNCSKYGEEAVRKYGIINGFKKIAWRILKCNPFNPGGIDELK